MSGNNGFEDPILGEEPTYDEDEQYWTDIILADRLREIVCPLCEETKQVEVDAHYIYNCGCGRRIQVPTPPV